MTLVGAWLCEEGEKSISTAHGVLFDVSLLEQEILYAPTRSWARGGGRFTARR